MPYEDAVAKLRTRLSRIPLNEDARRVLESRDAVLSRYQPMFSAEHLPELTEAEIHSFLLSENNRHWGGLHRHSPRIREDMPRLRATLRRLLDERRPIQERFDEAIGSVRGMGKAIITAVLLVTHPDRYGVWNNASEEGMRKIDVWPEMPRGASMGARYVELNNLLCRLASDLGTDLWTLDVLWWLPDDTGSVGGVAPAPGGGGDTDAGASFGLERHLHDFLRDNWNATPLGREWALYAEEGDEEAGYEYPTGVGRIDLLAKHRTRAEWLVIELKREQTSDATVGQVLRYIGWVRRNLAQPGDQVRGMVIARQPDDGLRYALSAVAGIELRLYEVEFRLRTAPEIGDGAE